MTEYTQHADAIFDLRKPNIGATHMQARDNLLASLESDATAPKMKQKVVVGSVVNSGSVILAGLASYQGFLADINATNASAAAKNIQMELSDNGSTFYGLTTIFTLQSSSSSVAKLSMDLATGSYSIIYNPRSATGAVTATIAGSSDAVTHLRFTTGGQTSIAVMLFPNGGYAS